MNYVENVPMQQILTIAAFFTTHVVMQIFIIRVVKTSLLRSIILSYFVNLLLLVVAEVILFSAQLQIDDFLGILITSALGYSCACYCYLSILNIGESSIRIRILNEMKNNGGQLAKAKVLADYNAKKIIDSRLYRLQLDHQIEEKNGLFYIKNRQLLMVAKCFQLLKRIFLGRNYDRPFEAVKTSS